MPSRFQVRFVPEGMRNSDEINKGCCKFLLGMAALFICFSFSFQNHKPKCYITDLFLPALNTYTNISSTTRANTFIFFDLKLENVMPFNGLRYDNVNLTFSYNYGGNRSSLFIPIARHTVPGFYQGMRKTAHKRDVTTTRGVPWGNAFAAVSNGSTAVSGWIWLLMLSPSSIFWYAGKQRLTVGGLWMLAAQV
ncbi:UNVERIFIED_CONTAM: hypothetical protein Slati_1032700 [Sesamum latifolium]|uniref:Uncharacterized protein n=1 Tax=Sesamum latifolium TaxID=2727402 RepID=A0AAW2XTQ7_9LAMI